MSDGMLNKLERRLGLPSLQQVADIATGDTGQRVDKILTRLEKLSKKDSAIIQAVELLKLVERLDDKGTLTELNELLNNIAPLTKGKASQQLLGLLQILVDKIDKLGEMLKSLMKEE